jgi:hypothetical protein
MKHPRDPSPESSNKLPKRDTDATNQLWMLLDFSLLTSHAEISARFDKLAESIFDDYTLCLHTDNKNVEYEILKLEFYLHKSGCHPDPFTHQTEEQAYTGQWYLSFVQFVCQFIPFGRYFHRAPTRSSGPNRSTSTGYRGGTRKGLDLTFGHHITSQHFASKSSDELLSTRGGILLRTIRRTTTGGQIISGPSLLVDEILSVSRAESISDLVQNKWKSDSMALLATPSSARASLYLKKRSRRKESSSRLYRTPRIGLELSHPSTTASPNDPRIIYISKPYRYIAYPNLLTFNGRCQTFLGIYQACLDSEEFGVYIKRV